MVLKIIAADGAAVVKGGSSMMMMRILFSKGVNGPDDRWMVRMKNDAAVGSVLSMAL